MCCHVVVTTVLQRQPESCVNKGQPQPKEKKLRQCPTTSQQCSHLLCAACFRRIRVGETGGQGPRQTTTDKARRTGGDAEHESAGALSNGPLSCS